MEANYKEIESVFFPSEIKNIHIAESLVEFICKANQLQEDAYGNILIAVTEAVNNAIQHGNKGNIGKNVFITVHQHGDELVFSIKDGGAGFDFLNLPDPTAPENIEKDCGRGIFLMRALADKVEFTENGSRVLLSFKQNL